MNSKYILGFLAVLGFVIITYIFTTPASREEANGEKTTETESVKDTGPVKSQPTYEGDDFKKIKSDLVLKEDEKYYEQAQNFYDAFRELVFSDGYAEYIRWIPSETNRWHVFFAITGKSGMYDRSIVFINKDKLTPKDFLKQISSSADALNSHIVQYDYEKGVILPINVRGLNKKPTFIHALKEKCYAFSQAEKRLKPQDQKAFDAWMKAIERLQVDRERLITFNRDYEFLYLEDGQIYVQNDDDGNKWFLDAHQNYLKSLSESKFSKKALIPFRTKGEEGLDLKCIRSLSKNSEEPSEEPKDSKSEEKAS
jgi:hypothetical protein